MSKHLIFHGKPLKLLEIFISMVSMSMSSDKTCKETKGFHSIPHINNKFLCETHVNYE